MLLGGLSPLVLRSSYLRKGKIENTIRGSRIDSILLFLILFVCIYDSPLRLLNIPILQTYSDELIIFLLLAKQIFTRGNKFNSDQYFVTIFIFGFLITGIVSCILNSQQNFIQNQINQGFLWMKMWIVVWFFWRTKIESSKVITYTILFLKSSMYISVISVILQLTSETWRLTFNGLYSDKRLFIESFAGFTAHPTFLASLSGVSTIVFLVFKSKYKYISKFDIFISIVLTLGTGRRRIILGIILCIFYIIFSHHIKNSISHKAFIMIAIFIVMIFISPLILDIGRSLVENYLTFGNLSARSLLYQYGYITAVKYFPLGAGFASFGTVESARNYSTTFIDFGFNSIYGLSNSYHSYVTDTFWPAVMAETGILGMIFYGGAIFLGVRIARRRILSPTESVFYRVLVALCIFTLIDSLGAQTYLSQPVAILFAIFFAVSTENISELKKNSKKSSL